MEKALVHSPYNKIITGWAYHHRHMSLTFFLLPRLAKLNTRTSVSTLEKEEFMLRKLMVCFVVAGLLVGHLQAISIGKLIKNPRIVNLLRSELDLRDRDIDSMKGIERLTRKYPNLRILDLRGNQLSSLPPEIGQLQHIEELSLQDNDLKTLPPEIGRLRKLRALALWGNQLTSLPAEIGQLQSLQHLGLNNNDLTSLPAEIAQLKK